MARGWEEYYDRLTELVAEGRMTTVGLICKTRGLKSRYDRLRARGLLTLQAIATRLQVRPDTVRTWSHHGLLRAHAYNDVNACLYEVPDPRLPPKSKGVKLAARKANSEKVDTITHEVQCEA